MASVSSKKTKALASLIFVFVVAVVVQAFTSATLFTNDRVVIWVFDVGQGDAIFIDAPEAQILIDGGRNAVVLEKLAAVMPFWDRDIDLLINTHPHADHVTGLNHVLERYDVGEVWVSGQEYGTDTFSFFETLGQEYTDWISVTAGDYIDLGSGAELEVLWPVQSVEGDLLNDTHDGNIVLEFTYGETSALLTGDFESEEELHILDDLSHIDVLKVGHHGSKTSTSRELLEAIRPDYAVIPVGASNDYGHPHKIVLDRLQTIGAFIFRTDLDGDIRILSDGGEPEVSTFDL